MKIVTVCIVCGNDAYDLMDFLRELDNSKHNNLNDILNSRDIAFRSSPEIIKFAEQMPNFEISDVSYYPADIYLSIDEIPDSATDVKIARCGEDSYDELIFYCVDGKIHSNDNTFFD